MTGFPRFWRKLRFVRLPAGRFSGTRRSDGATVGTGAAARALALPLQALAFVLHPLALFLDQVQPEPMDVEGDDPEADRQLKPVRMQNPPKIRQ